MNKPKSKTFSIRLTSEDMYRLDEIQKMRSEKLNKYQGMIKTNESWTDLIKHAIYRFYNETIEYFMYENQMYIKNEEKLPFE